MSAPLSWQRSADSSAPTVSDSLPPEVVTCLENARFVCRSQYLHTVHEETTRNTNAIVHQLHLATCTQNIPHVSLMNYTYLPSHPFPSSSALPPSSGPTIIMTSNPSSKKTLNLVANPHVSLLVHDWVSSRPPASTTTTGAADRERSPTGGPRSSLAAMLMQMNHTAMSSISATINGTATILPAGTEEEKWCKEQHLLNNTFEPTADGRSSVDLFGSSPAQTRQGGAGPVAEDGGRESYIADEDVRVVVVRIRDGRISDWKGEVKDWIIEQKEPAAEAAPLVNGV